MADRMAAEIQICGKISRAVVPELCSALQSANVSLEYGGGRLRPESADDLLTARVDYDGRLVLVLCDDDAS